MKGAANARIARCISQSGALPMALAVAAAATAASLSASVTEVLAFSWGGG